MRKEPLSRVYLDDYPITLMGDEATPPLSRIIRAGGKKPGLVDVIYLRSPADRDGRPVDPETIIDRTAEPTRPIYLRTLPKAIPVKTADRPGPPSIPDAPAAPTWRGPMPNLDPVISQLGGAPPKEPAETPHEEAVFRSPTQFPAQAPQATVADLRAAALAKAARIAKASSAQAAAEGEAEERQEDERNQEDTLQDEDEARQDADDDARQSPT